MKPTQPGLFNLQEVYTDPLTGLGNLFSCLSELAAAFQRPAAGNSQLYLLLLDVDGLTQINELLGTGSGDEALLLVKTTLLDVAAGQARSYRFGLDEFAVVTWSPGADQVLECARAIVAQYHTWAEALFPPPCCPTISVGVAGVDCAQSSIGELVALANAALYRAKQKGGNCVELAHGRPGSAHRREANLLTLFAGRILETLDIVANVGQMALTDPLSGLPNQRAAEHYLLQACDPVASRGTPTSLILLDGDHLKDYNDRFGYNRGNQMIRDLVTILQRVKRKDDFLARWFVGDEFLLILPDTDHEAALQVAERLRRTVEKATASWELPVTVSIGVATYPTDGGRMELLMQVVQEACAEAKRRGKNCVVSARELNP